MDRRDVFKLGLGALAAALVPKEQPMARLGDVFARIRNGQGSDADWEFLRVRLNQMDAVAGQSQQWLSPYGTLDTDTFARYEPTQGFSLLPHDGGKLTLASVQTIPTATWTPISSWDPDALTSFKFRVILSATSGITIKAQPFDSVFLVMANVTWELNTTGVRQIAVRNPNGSDSQYASAAAHATVGNTMSFAVPHRVSVSDPTLNLSVWQNSGGDLDVNAATFTVMRLR